MFSNLLAIPFISGALFFLYLAWTIDGKYAPWMIPFLVAAAVIYIMSPQINWWWYSRRPPRLSPQMLEMLQRFCPFFNRLSPGEKIVFEGRVALFRMGTDWTPLSWPDDAPLPPDVELALASQAVSLTFNKYTFLFKRFEKVIVYPKQFPTPEHPYLHSSELYEPDGCLIFSAENLMHGFFSAGKVYHVGLHEYAKAYLLEYPNESWPTWDAETVWETLEKISNLSREHIETTVGLAGLEPLPIMIHHFFIYRESFKTHAPEWFETLRFVFD